MFFKIIVMNLRALVTLFFLLKTDTFVQWFTLFKLETQCTM
uniref:Uncharacterized protein n=1 Tax=Anguilla anguilla TaxID=7936 RepID=A0A0E9W005_ANGAN